MRLLHGFIQTHIFPASVSTIAAIADNPASMKEILRSTDVTAIAFATALLEGEGIDVFPLDVHMSVLEGSLGLLPRRLMVADRDAFTAMAILRDNGLDPGL